MSPEMKYLLGPDPPEQIVSILNKLSASWKLVFLSERLCGKLIINCCQTKLVRCKQVKMWGRVESEIWNLAVTTLTSYWWHLLTAIVEDFYRGNWNSRVDCSMQVANSGHNDKKTKTKANKGKLEFRSWLHHRYFTDSLVSNLGQSLFQKMNFQTFFMQVCHHVNMYCVPHNQNSGER